MKLSLNFSSGTRGHWEEWAQLYLLATWVPGDLWGPMLLAGCSGLPRERAAAFAVSVSTGRPGRPVPCRACGQSFLQGPLVRNGRCLGDWGAVHICGVPVQDNLLQVWSGPAHLLHRNSGTSTPCSLRTNWLILQSALEMQRLRYKRPLPCTRRSVQRGLRCVVCLVNFMIAFGNYAFLFISLVKEINWMESPDGPKYCLYCPNHL